MNLSSNSRTGKPGIALYRKAVLLICITAVTLLFTACGGIMSGKLEIDRNFSGTRTITCSVSENELAQAVEGGTDTVHEIVENYCPKALKYSYTTSAGDLTYYFTLEFTDAASYRNLILSILPDSELEVLVGDGSFSSGIRLKEDFTDHDLLQWLDDALLASGKYKAEETEIWEQTSCELIIDGRTVYNLQPYSYDTYQGVTLKSVSVYTTVAEDGTLARDCVFLIPKDAYESAGDKFAAYLGERMPQDAQTQIDTSQAEAVSQTVSFTAQNASELDDKTRVLFGSKGLFAASSKPTSAFKSVVTYSEYLTFESFPAEEYRYFVKAESASENAGLSDCYGNSVLEDGYLSYPVENGELSVSYAKHRSFSASTVEVRIGYGLEQMEQATVRMNFTGISAASNAQSAADWYGTVTDHQYAMPQVISTSDGYELSAILTAEDSSLQCLESWFHAERVSDMELERRLFSDRIRILLDCDFSPLMEESGAKQLTLTLSLPQGMEFTSVRQDGNSVRCSGSEYTVWASSFYIIATARVLRTDRIILAVLLCVLILIAAVLCAAAGIRLHLKRKGGNENETFLTTMHESIRVCFSGRLPKQADKEGVRYFYGKRGPQILFFTGIVIVPLVWSVIYLICYEKANSFYFFSGMLRYLSVTLFVLCALTAPISLIWRYYQKAPLGSETGHRMAEKTLQMAKTEIAQNHNRILTTSGKTPVFDTAVMVPDAFEKRGTLYQRLCSKTVRQFSRRFPDIERPVCVYLESDKIAASRTLVQNVMLIDGRLIITSSLVNPAFDQVTQLAANEISVSQISRFSKEETVLYAHYRDGMFVRTKRVKFAKAVIVTQAKQKITFCLPDSKQTAQTLKELASAIEDAIKA